MKNTEVAPGLEVAGDSNSIAFDTESEKLERAKLLYSQFMAYMKANADIEKKWVNEAFDLANTNGTFSARLLVEKLRAKSYTDKQGQDVKIPNEFTPLLARYLVGKYPELTSHMILRRSIFDKVMNER